MANAAKVDMNKAKTIMFEMKSFFVDVYTDRDHTNYQSLKKDFIKQLKLFDKAYAKHVKKNSTHDIMEKDIHQKCMEPLNLLCEKNNYFYQLERAIE